VRTRHIPLGRLLAGFCVGALLGCGQKEPAPAAKTPSAAAPAKPPGSAAAAHSATHAPTNVVAIPQSVFVSDPAVAKDPFYPNSHRRANEVAATKPGKSEPVVFNVLSALNLVNITGSESERVAIVNDAILEAGRLAEITVTQGDQTQKIKVRCLKITKTSVVLIVEGQPKPIELHAP
jgi:hypothetical protein